MLLVCYPKCGTCKKAQEWLDAHGIVYEYRDIKLHKPSYEELIKWHELSGLPLKKFFNTSGLLYKELGLKGKLINMDNEEQLRLLATDGMLVKRPIVITGQQVLVGFKELDWQAVLLEK